MSRKLDIYGYITVYPERPTNYLDFGYWSDDVEYFTTIAGIPFVRRETAGTDLGYSVYALLKSSSLGDDPLTSPDVWKLVDSNEFIYMLNAHIEHLQSKLVTAEKIVTLDITTRRLLAYDNLMNLLTSINRNGEGEIIQYYPSGNMVMQINGGLITHYNDNENNTPAWELGIGGSISKTELDRWTAVNLFKYTHVDEIKTPDSLPGQRYFKFAPGTLSVYESYAGLTLDVISEPTVTPNLANVNDFIADGFYTIAFRPAEQAITNVNDQPHWMRVVYQFQNGKIIYTEEVTWTFGQGEIPR